MLILSLINVEDVWCIEPTGFNLQNLDHYGPSKKLYWSRCTNKTEEKNKSISVDPAVPGMHTCGLSVTCKHTKLYPNCEITVWVAAEVLVCQRS